MDGEPVTGDLCGEQTLEKQKVYSAAITVYYYASSYTEPGSFKLLVFALSAGEIQTHFWFKYP